MTAILNLIMYTVITYQSHETCYCVRIFALVKTLVYAMQCQLTNTVISLISDAFHLSCCAPQCSYINSIFPVTVWKSTSMYESLQRFDILWDGIMCTTRCMRGHMKRTACIFFTQQKNTLLLCFCQTDFNTFKIQSEKQFPVITVSYFPFVWTVGKDFVACRWSAGTYNFVFFCKDFH